MPDYVIYSVSVVKIKRVERTSSLVARVGPESSSLYVEGSARCFLILLI